MSTITKKSKIALLFTSYKHIELSINKIVIIA